MSNLRQAPRAYIRSLPATSTGACDCSLLVEGAALDPLVLTASRTFRRLPIRRCEELLMSTTVVAVPSMSLYRSPTSVRSSDCFASAASLRGRIEHVVQVIPQLSSAGHCISLASLLKTARSLSSSSAHLPSPPRIECLRNDSPYAPFELPDFTYAQLGKDLIRVSGHRV